MKRPVEDDGDFANKRPARGPRGPQANSAFKVLCPDSLVSSIIGVQGNSRKAMEEETGARLRISGRDEYYPNSRCRIVVATANEGTQVIAMLEQIVTKLVDVGNTEHDLREKGAGKGGKRGEDADLLTGKEPGEFVFRAALPASCTGALIGSKGARIKSLREKTGAKVFIDNDSYDGHQMVRIIGSPDAICAAFPEMLAVVEEELPEERLAQWAGILALDPYGGHEPKGKGKGLRKDGGGEDHGNWSHPGGDRWHHRGDAPDFHREAPPPAARGFSAARATLEAMMVVADHFPPGAVDMAHAVSCDLPNSRVGALIGRKGDFINHVQRVTGAQVTFNEAGKGTNVSHRTMTVQGPLVAVYHAHMMMMQKYHEDEASAWAEPARPPPRRPMDEVRIEDLQGRLADLERQLEDARGSLGGKGHPRFGKGKR